MEIEVLTKDGKVVTRDLEKFMAERFNLSDTASWYIGVFGAKILELQAELDALRAYNSHQLLDLPPRKREICQGCTLPREAKQLQADKESWQRTKKDYDGHCVITAKLLQEDNKRIQQDTDQLEAKDKQIEALREKNKRQRRRIRALNRKFKDW